MLANSVWIVVEVRSGIPVSVKAFPSFELAMIYSDLLKISLNPDNDETGVFQVDLKQEFSPI